jgi:hypothetical protein
MLKLFSVISLLYISLFAVVGCTAVKTEKKIIKKTETPTVHKKVSILPSRMYEECIELDPAQVMKYSFKTSRPVDFNIHYHGEDRIHYPVSRNDISSWRGVMSVKELDFYSEGNEYFCLMWENRSVKKVHLEFECELIQ